MPHFRPFGMGFAVKKGFKMALGEVFSPKNGPNGLIFAQWVDIMGNILKITEGIRDI